MARGLFLLDSIIKLLYLIASMKFSQTHDPFATRYAALQQQIESISSVEGVVIRADAPDGVSSPNDSASRVALGSLGKTTPTEKEGARGSQRGITLIGVSKGQPVQALEAALGLGLRVFGENKVQEAAQKWPALRAAHPDVVLHLIGPLQSNKAREAVALFDVIQTVDRPKIAEALAVEMARAGKTPKLLVQVNIGEEPQKAGVALAELPGLLAHCQSLGLVISGLMCVPPDGVNPAPFFALMQKLAVRHDLRELSMGMSGDYVTAIRMGATMVRVGTALFGERV